MDRQRGAQKDHPPGEPLFRLPPRHRLLRSRATAVDATTSASALARYRRGPTTQEAERHESTRRAPPARAATTTKSSHCPRRTTTPQQERRTGGGRKRSSSRYYTPYTRSQIRNSRNSHADTCYHKSLYCCKQYWTVSGLARGGVFPVADLWVRVVTAALACCADSLPRSSTRARQARTPPQEASPHQLRSQNSPGFECSSSSSSVASLSSSSCSSRQVFQRVTLASSSPAGSAGSRKAASRSASLPAYRRPSSCRSRRGPKNPESRAESRGLRDCRYVR